MDWSRDKIEILLSVICISSDNNNDMYTYEDNEEVM